MSRRVLWLAFGALSLGFVVVSCTSADGDANFEPTGGQGSGGDSSSDAGESSTAGSKTTGGSNADAGAGQGQAGQGQGEGGNGTPIGGQSSGDAGTPGGGTDPMGGMPGGGVPGGGGDATSGGVPADGGTGSTGDAGAGGAGDSRPPCASYKNCEAGEVCLKEGCDDQKAGVCVEAAAASPVCGCDGVTYYDGSLANAAEVDVRDRGVCTGDTAMACDAECKEGLTCGQVRLRGSDCVSKIPGVCWQLPKECPLDELTTFNVCGSDKCLSLCEAVENAAPAVGGSLVCSILANQ